MTKEKTIPDISRREMALLATFDLAIVLAFAAQYFAMNLFFLVYAPDFSYVGTPLEQWVSASSTGLLFYTDAILIILFAFVNFYYFLFPVLENFVGRYKFGITLIDTKEPDTTPPEKSL